MPDKNTAAIGFEKQIWDAACVLRGNMDASEYKNVVLGLIFLKYISDRFDEKYKALVEEGDIIKINIPEMTLELDVSDEVLAERRKNWTPREPKVTTGYLARYASMVTSGNRGAILAIDK